MEKTQGSNCAAFCGLPGLLTTRTNHGLLSPLHAREARVYRPAKARTAIIQRPCANMPGNVEDLPLELIPHTGEPMPPYWNQPGVYGVYAASGELQYVAAVEDVGQAIYSHVRIIGDAQRVHAVRMMTVPNVDDAPLCAMAENWVMALVNNGFETPPGNCDDAPEWREELKSPDVSFSGTVVAGDAESRVDEEIKTILRDHRVVLFMKGTRAAPRCGFSRAVVDVMEQQAGDDFVCVDCLDKAKNPGLREGIKKYSNWPTIPQLFINGDFVGGADIVQGMVTNGELAAVLAS